MVRQVEKPEMLGGRTAEQWSRTLVPLSTTTLVLGGVVFVSYFLTGGTAATVPVWLYVMVVLAAVSFCTLMVNIFAMLFKAIREGKAGYTTTGGMYPELPQLDSETGEVLREAPDLKK